MVLVALHHRPTSRIILCGSVQRHARECVLRGAEEDEEDDEEDEPLPAVKVRTNPSQLRRSRSRPLCAQPAEHEVDQKDRVCVQSTAGRLESVIA